jgi:fused signal recognition particle receptor
MEIAIAVCTLLALSLGCFFIRRGRPRSAPPKAPEATLGNALSKTRGFWLQGLSGWVKRKGSDLGGEEWEALEETLLLADISLSTSQLLLKAVKEKSLKNKDLDLGALIRAEVETLLGSVQNGWSLSGARKPVVVSIVGVNGVGKTTTVGKLAAHFSGEGKKVLVGACDTFRAAAVGQLEIWAQRAGCQFVSGREGADPGATAFDAVSAGVARGMDLVILDTAGRLHTKTHLMDELKRVHKVVKKVIPEAPHEVWLVVDGTMGQNALVQAKQFHEALSLSGIVVTKLDGTAKGGTLLSIVSDLKLGIRYVGVGEGASDLLPFVSSEFAEGLLS